MTPLIVQTPTSTRKGRLTHGMVLIAFLFIGLLQTIVAFVAFQRADDHSYFMSIANDGLSGLRETDADFLALKSKAAAFVFHTIASPSRWLGGSDVLHLVWFRVLTLLGFACAFEWVQRVALTRSNARTRSDMRDARIRFFTLCLLYPGQLAWTASLLRDGIACALLFAALLAWSTSRWVLCGIMMISSLALRPEFGIVVLTVLAWILTADRGWLRSGRGWKLLLTCAVISVATFDQRNAASEFSQLAFSEEGAAYPVVSSFTDIAGYAMVAWQAILDPIAVGGLSSGSPFQLAEVAFFLYLLGLTWQTLKDAPPRIAALLAASLTSMWIFAFFEIYVSGFSRHRLFLTVLLIAVLVLAPRASRLSGDSAPNRLSRQRRRSKQAHCDNIIPIRPIP